MLKERKTAVKLNLTVNKESVYDISILEGRRFSKRVKSLDINYEFGVKADQNKFANSVPFIEHLKINYAY